MAHNYGRGNVGIGLDTVPGTSILVARDDETVESRFEYAALRRNDGYWVIRCRPLRGGSWEMAITGNVTKTADLCIAGFARVTCDNPTWSKTVLLHPVAISTVAQITEARAQAAERARIERADAEMWAAREEERRQALDDAYRKAKPRFTRFGPRLYSSSTPGESFEIKGFAYQGLMAGSRPSGHRLGGRYGCTHIESGKLCGSYETFADAKLAAWRFAQLWDWTGTEKALQVKLKADTALASSCILLSRDAYAELPSASMPPA